MKYKKLIKTSLIIGLVYISGYLVVNLNLKSFEMDLIDFSENATFNLNFIDSMITTSAWGYVYNGSDTTLIKFRTNEIEGIGSLDSSSLILNSSLYGYNFENVNINQFNTFDWILNYLYKPNISIVIDTLTTSNIQVNFRSKKGKLIDSTYCEAFNVYIINKSNIIVPIEM